jgi:hypothetical protein
VEQVINRANLTNKEHDIPVPFFKKEFILGKNAAMFSLGPLRIGSDLIKTKRRLKKKTIFVNRRLSEVYQQVKKISASPNAPIY